jgi:hypothetical protein
MVCMLSDMRQSAASDIDTVSNKKMGRDGICRGEYLQRLAVRVVYRLILVIDRYAVATVNKYKMTL